MARCPNCHRRVGRGRNCPVDGAAVPALEAAASSAPPNCPEGLRLGEKLGAGGFANVWSAIRSDGTEVALKTLQHPTDIDRARLTLEAKALRQIGPPFTPKLIEAETGRGVANYLVMERVVGDTLASMLEDGPINGPRLRRLCDSVLEAIDAAHAAGTVHRDLKPENIIVETSSGRARLVDFGLATTSSADHASVTRTGAVVGSALYMSPEQCAGGAIDQRADIYAFGVILYELLTGRPPFVGDVATIENGHRSLRPTRPSHFAEVPAAVERLVLHCLAKDAGDRPRSASEVREGLRRSWGGATTHVSPARTGSSLLVGKREPAVIVAVDLDDLGAVDAAVRFHGGSVTRRDGTRCLCVFPGFQSADPVQAGLGAARELTSIGASRVAVHLASLAIRKRRRGPPSVAGEAIEKPQTWLPTRWRGLVLTSAIVQTGAAFATRPSRGNPGFYRFADAATRLAASEGWAATLLERGDLLSSAEAQLETVIETRAAALLTVVGETGSGRSRVASELATLCWARGELDVVRLRGGSMEAEDDLLRCLNGDGPAAVILDDAERFEASVLGAVERATIGEDRALWVAVITDPSLEKMRPRWGMLAERHSRVELAPLSERGSMEMAAELLYPADYPPAAFLRRLAAWAGGMPKLLVGLVGELKQQGIVRRRDHGDGWFVSTNELEELPPQAAEQWIAARALASMSPEVAACARVCAVLGETFYRDELRAVLDAADWRGNAASPIDAGVGISRLIDFELVDVSGPDCLSFRSAATQRAIYDALAAPDRRMIHRSAATLWTAKRPGVGGKTRSLRRFSRHAACGGLKALAAEALIELGRRALSRFRPLVADADFSSALGLTEAASLRLSAQTGRARARGLLHRTGEALDDARAARALADSIGDHEAVIDLLLIESMVADSAGEYELAAGCAEAAREKLRERADSALGARVALAEGRALWRQGDAETAIPVLREATVADVDAATRIHATLLLAPAQVATGQLERAAAAFDSVIELCQQVGDRLHECAAYGNRMYLWIAREEIEPALADLRNSISLARELGNPEPERVATHNLAELLYWRGEHDEALVHAKRARTLQKRFWKDTPLDALLLARIRAARGEMADASELLEWIEALGEATDVASALMTEMLALVVRGGDEHKWDALATQVEAELPPEEFVEVACWRARIAIEAGEASGASRFIAVAEARLSDAPIWRPHVEALSAQIRARRMRRRVTEASIVDGSARAR